MIVRKLRGNERNSQCKTTEFDYDKIGGLLLNIYYANLFKLLLFY